MGFWLEFVAKLCFKLGFVSGHGFIRAEKSPQNKGIWYRMLGARGILVDNIPEVCFRSGADWARDI